VNKLFFVILSNLLLPISVLAESCPEVLKGKNYEIKNKSSATYLAWDSKKLTKDTKWSECILGNQSGFFAKTKCGEREIIINTLNNRQWAVDKSARQWEILFPNEQYNGTFPCKKLSDSEYLQVETSMDRGVIEGPGINIIFRTDYKTTYSVFTSDF